MTHAGPMLVASGLCGFIWTLLLWFRETCSPGVLHSLCLLCSFCLLFVGVLCVSLPISFRAVYSKISLSLRNVWLWLSFFVLTCCRRELLRWWLNKVLFYKNSIISLGIILWLLFKKTSVIWSLGSLVSGSWPPKQCLVWVPYHGAGLESN